MNQLKPQFGSMPIESPERKGLVLDLPMLGIGDLYDYSLNSNDGTNNGATWVAGPYGPALSFNGSSDYVSTPLNITTIAEDMTIVVCVRPTNTGAGLRYIVDHSPGSTGYALRQAGQAVTFFCYSSAGAGVVTVNSVLNAGESVVLACVHSSSGNILYANGELIGSTASASGIIDATGSAIIGRRQDSAAEYFNGNIEYCNIYARALSASEIKQITDFPWQAYEQDNIILWGGSQAPATGGVNLLTGLLQQPSRLIA